MPRPGYRVRLENGLKLDLNKLVRRGFVTPGERTGPIGIRWASDYWGEIATGVIWSDMRYTPGTFQINLGALDQKIVLESQPRHFGGAQWYFLCPSTFWPVSVLWKPPGATKFSGRRTWGRRVAYASQFLAPYHRWSHAQSKIKGRLIADLDPDDWDFPPKPKWMRWRTYHRYETRFDRLEDRKDADLDGTIFRLLPRLGNLV